jgi:hypothetical protein
MKLRDLCEALQKIDDEFDGRIEFTIDAKKVSEFDITEAADGHSFLGGSFAIDLLELDVDVTHKDIADACKNWGYKYELPISRK